MTMRPSSKALLPLVAIVAMVTLASAFFVVFSRPSSASIFAGQTSSLVTAAAASSSSSKQRVALPQRLVIPKLKVDAFVESVGLTPKRDMDVPTKWQDVGWYKFGPRPGEVGNSVIAGHFDSETGPAVFWKLKQLQEGDEYSVMDADGKEHHFRVTDVQVYNADTAPIDLIFGPSDKPMLNLITCGGVWNTTTRRYEERLAVFGELIDSRL
jgi:sortase A